MATLHAGPRVHRAGPDYLTADDVAAMGIEPRDVPGATELVALDGSPCWSASDLGLDAGGDA